MQRGQQLEPSCIFTTTGVIENIDMCQVCPSAKASNVWSHMKTYHACSEDFFKKSSPEASQALQDLSVYLSRKVAPTLFFQMWRREKAGGEGLESGVRERLS